MKIKKEGYCQNDLYKKSYKLKLLSDSDRQYSCHASASSPKWLSSSEKLGESSQTRIVSVLLKMDKQKARPSGVQKRCNKALSDQTRAKWPNKATTSSTDETLQVEASRHTYAAALAASQSRQSETSLPGQGNDSGIAPPLLSTLENSDSSSTESASSSSESAGPPSPPFCEHW